MRPVVTAQPESTAESVPLAPAATDWLRQTLTVTGPAEAVARFRDAAAGPGIIPWQRDLDRLEEDWFLPMATPADGVPAISLAGAKILARRLREAVAANQQRAPQRLGDHGQPTGGAGPHALVSMAGVAYRRWYAWNWPSRRSRRCVDSGAAARSRSGLHGRTGRTRVPVGRAREFGAKLPG